MIWFLAEDIYYYINPRQKLKKFLNGHKLVILPSEEEVKKLIKEGENFDVIASYLPPYDVRSLFVVKFLDNLGDGILTSQEVKFLEKIEDLSERKKEQRRLYEEKVGVKIHDVKTINISEKDLIGLDNVKSYAFSLKLSKNLKGRKGVFLVGIPGTGKSFSAKFVAKILGYYLVEFNIAKILEEENFVYKLHQVFKFLERASQAKEIGWVIWIDEIEKVFSQESGKDEKRLFGQFLTILNDLNTPTGYNINGIFWVTANDISTIIEKNPEFLRRGRFDELFFVDNPRLDSAVELFEHYAKKIGLTKLKKDFAEMMVNLTVNFVYAKESSILGSKSKDRFIYVPAEIETIVSKLKERSEINKILLSTEDYQKQKELTRVLFTRQIYEKGKYFFERFFNISNYDLDLLLQKQIELLSSSREEITDLDKIAVLIFIQPLGVSFADSISKMRSNEKFFTLAD